MRSPVGDESRVYTKTANGWTSIRVIWRYQHISAEVNARAPREAGLDPNMVVSLAHTQQARIERTLRSGG